jgi:hypothetical protein
VINSELFKLIKSVVRSIDRYVTIQAYINYNEIPLGFRDKYKEAVLDDKSNGN